MSIEIIHSLVLIGAILFSYLLTQSGLRHYDLQVVAGLFIGYFLFKKKYPRLQFRIIDALVTTMVISTIIATTGGLSSKLFFLNYFLIFSLSLLLEPIISITTTVTLVFFYLSTNDLSQSLDYFLPLFSLPFLTPFALLLGQEYRRAVVQNEKIKDVHFFLALIVKNHLTRLKELTDNFRGDNELHQIKKNLARMERQLDHYEKSL